MFWLSWNLSLQCWSGNMSCDDLSRNRSFNWLGFLFNLLTLSVRVGGWEVSRTYLRESKLLTFRWILLFNLWIVKSFCWYHFYTLSILQTRLALLRNAFNHLIILLFRQSKILLRYSAISFDDNFGSYTIWHALFHSWTSWTIFNHDSQLLTHRF